MTPVRFEAFDRRRTALHEAGHVVMGRAIGIRDICAVIWRNPKPTPDEKLWFGTTMCQTRRISAASLRLFGVAGVAAETFSERLSAEDIDFYEPACMSASDWAACNCEPGVPDAALFEAADEAVNLLGGRLWPDLLRYARKLIVSSRQPC